MTTPAISIDARDLLLTGKPTISVNARDARIAAQIIGKALKHLADNPGTAKDIADWETRTGLGTMVAEALKGGRSIEVKS